MSSPGDRSPRSAGTARGRCRLSGGASWGREGRTGELLRVGRNFGVVCAGSTSSSPEIRVPPPGIPWASSNISGHFPGHPQTSLDSPNLPGHPQTSLGTHKPPWGPPNLSGLSKPPWASPNLPGHLLGHPQTSLGTPKPHWTLSNFPGHSQTSLDTSLNTPKPRCTPPNLPGHPQTSLVTPKPPWTPPWTPSNLAGQLQTSLPIPAHPCPSFPWGNSSGSHPLEQTPTLPACPLLCRAQNSPCASFSPG